MSRYRVSFSRLARGVVMGAVLALVTIGFFAGKTALAHCDGLDGPVVIAAQKALQSGDLNPVLIWVQPKDEDEIKRVFEEKRLPFAS